MIAALLARLAPYKLLFEVIVIGALAAGVLYGVHEFLEHERDIGRNEVQARWDAQQKKDIDAARLHEAELTAQLDRALQEGANREALIRTLAAGSSAANLGLRDTLAAIRAGVPNASADALGKSVATLSTVLADCSGRYQALAERADRHASDVKTLQYAWPTNPQPAQR
jgi:hypothetical protein